MTTLEPIKYDDDLRAKRTTFDSSYAEWLFLRSEELRNFDGDEEAQRREERQEELARMITTTPAPYFWVVLRKLEVLEYYLGSLGGTTWSDNREVVMLGGIKADLLRVQLRGG